MLHQCFKGQFGGNVKQPQGCFPLIGLWSSGAEFQVSEDVLMRTSAVPEAFLETAGGGEPPPSPHVEAAEVT